MMTKEKPEGFNKRFDIAGCFVQHDGKFLLLRRQPDKANGNTWGLPAGKADPGESMLQALLREVQEETSLQLSEESITYFDSLYVRDGDFDIEWHMYATTHEAQPIVQINPKEHSEYKWVTPEESLSMDLIHDMPESIKLFFNM